MVGYTFLDEGIVYSDEEDDNDNATTESVLVATSMIIEWEVKAGVLESITETHTIEEWEVETLDIQFSSAYLHQW